MDCNAGLQLGRKLQQDAVMMHGGVPMEANMGPEHDMLMQAPVMMPPPPQAMMNAGADWAHAFAQQQQHQQQQVAVVRQQHEVQQQVMQQQQVAMGAAPAMTAAAVSGPMMMNPMMSGMMAANLGMGMMVPRTQYQPTLNLQSQTLVAPQSTVATTAGQDSAWSSQLGQQQWGQDYTQVPSYTVAGQEEATVEQKTKDSEFYAFMDRIRNKEVLIDEEKGELVAGPGPEPQDMADADTAHLRDWATAEGIELPPEAFQATRPAAAAPREDVAMNDYPDDAMELTEEGIEDWVKEYKEMQDRVHRAVNSTDYPFEPNNPYVHQEDPMQSGLEMLQLSNLAEAALAFEAICQRDPDNFEAWRLLGTTQAENEKDALAIIALNNARRLRPNDINVHAALCVSHTNEHNNDAAIESLRAWLLNHPEYNQLANITLPAEPEQDLEMTETFYFADPTNVREVSTLYNAAVEMNPQDYQLHSNLGVLFNVAHDYDLAAQHFRRAVELRPQDATLWNKLGASLANGSHAEEAIDAYTHALDLNPGFVRAMYNMAVAYSNLGRYPEAARQTVRAIMAQQGDTNPTGEGSEFATRGMWDLLRMTLSLMDRDDLVQLTHAQKLEPFIKEFGLEGFA